MLLIKSNLSSLPIYQGSTLLAMVGIMQQIRKEIQNLLWKEGKTNTKRFHLINWNTNRDLKQNGNMEIKDPMLLNLASW